MGGATAIIIARHTPKAPLEPSSYSHCRSSQEPAQRILESKKGSNKNRGEVWGRRRWCWRGRPVCEDHSLAHSHTQGVLWSSSLTTFLERGVWGHGEVVAGCPARLRSGGGRSRGRGGMRGDVRQEGGADWWAEADSLLRIHTLPQEHTWCNCILQNLFFPPCSPGRFMAVFSCFLWMLSKANCFPTLAVPLSSLPRLVSWLGLQKWALLLAFLFNQMWEGLIQKAKDGGLDVIQTYVFWNGHEPTPGNVRNFTPSALPFRCHHYELIQDSDGIFSLPAVLFRREVRFGQVHKDGPESRSVCTSPHRSLHLWRVELRVFLHFLKSPP